MIRDATQHRKATNIEKRLLEDDGMSDSVDSEIGHYRSPNPSSGKKKHLKDESLNDL